MTALIVYASFTGNNEAVTQILRDALIALDVDVKVEECQMISPIAFKDYDLCIIVTYTWGREGEIPDEFCDFFDELAHVNLKGKVYGVLGSGDTLYNDLYCKAVEDFDKQMSLTGASKGSEALKIDSYPQKNDDLNIAQFAKRLVQSFL
ncbi:MAG TPA: flavodoxin [Edaphocola sp.]|nr:flavodoxin [Edaphocola sp.]